MPRRRRSPPPPCPRCSGATRRQRRRWFDRLAKRWRAGPAMRRWCCLSASCGWSGLLPRHGAEVGDGLPAAPAVAAPPAIRAAVAALVLATLGVTAIAGWRWWQPQPATRVQVGPYELAPGEHYVGDPLPRQHPLLRTVYRAGADPAAPVASASAAAQPATLQLRRHCAWGDPGRDPYRGSVEEALRTAQLPEEVVQKIAAAVRANKPSDRLTISNTGIQADHGGQIYNHRSFALTYGRTLCLASSVNFKIGHVERASLYAASDDSGRLHSVMVPDVCGNVSILRTERTASDEAFDDVTADGARRPQGGASGAAAQGVPLPGTLACSGLGLAALGWWRLRRRRDRAAAHAAGAGQAGGG